MTTNPLAPSTAVCGPPARRIVLQSALKPVRRRVGGRTCLGLVWILVEPFLFTN